MKTIIPSAVLLTLLTVDPSWAATLYVNAGNATPEFPFDSFLKAATAIQDAVDAAAAGDLILVTNGLYNTGVRNVGAETTGTRVAVDKAVTLKSLNGPEFTTIEGHQNPGSMNDADAIRCVRLANGAVLSGFTLTNGGSAVGAGVSCAGTAAIVTNCILVRNIAYDWGVWPSSRGGGASGGTLQNCTLIGNIALWGGGTYQATLHSCTVRGNMATECGGGAYGGTLNNCIVAGNFTRNAGSGEGGGAYAATLNNCLVISNTAHSFVGDRMGTAGGASGCKMNNCTIVANSADIFGRRVWLVAAESS